MRKLLRKTDLHWRFYNMAELLAWKEAHPRYKWPSWAIRLKKPLTLDRYIGKLSDDYSYYKLSVYYYENTLYVEQRWWADTNRPQYTIIQVQTDDIEAVLANLNIKAL